jgi:cytochrome c6
MRVENGGEGSKYEFRADFAARRGIMREKMDWIGKVILIGAVLTGGFLSTSVKADNTAEPTYKSKCAACHGPDGKGETAIGKTNKIRDLASADVQKQSDDDLAGVIASGKGKMPAYAKSLKPDQIKGLVAYIRSLGKKS